MRLKYTIHRRYITPTERELHNWQVQQRGFVGTLVFPYFHREIPLEITHFIYLSLPPHYRIGYRIDENIPEISDSPTPAQYCIRQGICEYRIDRVATEPLPTNSSKLRRSVEYSIDSIQRFLLKEDKKH